MSATLQWPEVHLVLRLSSKKMESVTRFQILYEVVYISRHVNALGKGMNLSILLLVMVR